MNFFKNISNLVCIDNQKQLFKFGKDMNDINVINDGAIVFDDKFRFVGTTDDAYKFISDNQLNIQNTKTLNGKTIIPGFVDSHTHIVFAGNRSEEFGKRLSGATYKEIADSGGGIQTTVKATRIASIEQLTKNGIKLLESAIGYGTTTIEIKSGYSLNFDGEIKQLKAIQNIKHILKDNNLDINVISTFMGAHDFPAEYKNTKEGRENYIKIITDEMLPYIVENKLADYCDIFIDEGYFTNSDAEKIFDKSLSLGLPIKAHCDELANVEAAGYSSNKGAVSVDHLLYISDESIKSLYKNQTVANLLPGTAYFIRLPYAPARKLIENNVIVSLATDCNPGSCFTENMQLIMNLAAINMKMSAEECLTAATLNSAYSLRLSDKVGSIEIDKKADFLILKEDNYLDLFYHFGINHIQDVYVSGNIFNGFIEIN